MTEKQKKMKGEVEHSVQLRVTAFIITGISLAAFCFYADAPLVITMFYVTAAAVGSYLSYLFRKRKSQWITIVTILGTCAVLGSFIGEALKEFYGAGKLLVPFMRVLCGLLVLHTFDLKTRNDLYICSLIALGLLGCIASQTDKNISFAAFPLAFIISGAALLYFLALSHSQDGSPSLINESNRPIQANVLNPASPRKAARYQAGSTLMAVATLPLATLVLFSMLPRTGYSLVEIIAEQARFLIVRVQEHFQPAIKPSPVYKPAPKISLPPFSRLSDKGKPKPAPGPTFKPPQNREGNRPGQARKQATNANAQSKEAGDLPPPPKREAMSGYRNKAGGKEGNGKPAPGETKPGTSKGKPGAKGRPASSPQPNNQPQMLLGTTKGAPTKNLETHVMTVFANRPLYLRCGAFDSYTGDRWQYSRAQSWMAWKKIGKDGFDVSSYPSLRLPTTFIGSEVEARVEIKSELPPLIPTGWIPQSLYFPQPVSIGNDGSLRADGPLRPGLFYTAVALVPSANLEEMRAGNMPTGEDLENILIIGKRFLTLPANFRPELKKLALSAAGAEGNWFRKAENIANYLRKNYKYTIQHPVLEPGEDALSRFLLKEKEGTCGEFATAEVLLCRACGIPARCVIGFSPGDPVPESDEFIVKLKHEHAWAEVFSPTHGWVPIDATPSGQLPVQPKQENVGGRTVFRSTHKVKPQQKPQTKDSQWSWAAKWQNPYVIAVLVGVLIFLVLDATAKTIAWLRSRQSRETAGPNKRTSTSMYLRLVKDLERLSIAKAPSDTPTDLATRVHKLMDNGGGYSYELKMELPVLVDNFVEQYYFDRFGNEEGKIPEYDKLGEIGDKIHELVLQSTLTSAPRK
ncbi:MAG TPA: transglutaminaseTgpA domain-containing protein [Candidatus Obscuribacterales bacterium]